MYKVFDSFNYNILINQKSTNVRKIALIICLLGTLFNLLILNTKTSISNAKDEVIDLNFKYIATKKEYHEIPRRIIINKSINTIIEPVKLTNGTWPISNDKANYGIESGYLDNPYSNIMVFAHARKNLFKDLKNVDIGDKITIIGTNSIYTYKVVSKEKVSPNEVNKIKAFGDTNLSLFTCEGIYDEYRLLIKAKQIHKENLLNKEVT